MPGAHLIGSVPLADTEAVFRTVAGALGPHLSRIPDGETGERRRCLPTPMASAYMYVSHRARRR